MLKVHVIFEGDILIIGIHLYAVFINFVCIFIHKSLYMIEAFHYHKRIGLAKLKILLSKLLIKVICVDYGVNIDEIRKIRDRF